MKKLIFMTILIPSLSSLIVAQTDRIQSNFSFSQGNVTSDKWDLKEAVVAGYTPLRTSGESPNFAVTFKYFRQLKEQILIGGGLEYYGFALALNGMSYYKFPLIKDRLNLLGGAGINFLLGPDAEKIIRPMASVRLDLHISKLNSVGIEAMNPILFNYEGQDYINSSFLLVSLGFKF
ncbi:MAG: hypothetical protein ABI528_04225 [bacterium]